ncbi:MAG: GYF domain-containing protein [Candidatus Methylacidiphilales bacterium]|nr:GYF domain-containing protein [Candidatus Methylacidiphilales bacterium]
MSTEHPARLWHYALSGQKGGPVEEKELKRLRMVGVLNDASLVWTEGWPDWRPLGTVPELIPSPSSPPVPPPDPPFQPQPHASTPAGSQNPDGAAVAVVICGAIGISGIVCCATTPVSLVAIILGHLTLARTDLTMNSRNLALVGTVLGYGGIVLLILPLLAGMIWGGWGNHLPEIFRHWRPGVGI